MALKMGKTAEEIAELASKKMNMLGQGDITDKYKEMMMELTPDDLKVEKNETVALEKITDRGKDMVVELKLSDLSSSPRNCYNRLKGEKKEEFISSLKTFGQINPIVVRPKESVENYKDEIDGSFEILAGHTRVEGLREIGEETARAIIVNCNDVEATLLIAQSNIQREEVTEIEIARAYKNTYEAMKKDKNANLKNVEISTSSSKCQSDTSRRTDELVAERYGISARTLTRKMALAYCTDKVVDFYSKKKFNQEQIQSISKMDSEAQDLVCEILWDEKLKMTNSLAKDVLKTYEKEKANPHLMRSFPLNIMRDCIRAGQSKDEKKIKLKRGAEEASESEKGNWLISIPKRMFSDDIKDSEAARDCIMLLLEKKNAKNEA